MAQLIDFKAGDITSVQNAYAIELTAVIRARLIANGMADPVLTTTTTTIVNALKEQENPLINLIITKVYNRVQSTLLNDLIIQTQNIVTDVAQDIFTKTITVTKSNVNANKSF
jgi:DNA-directed RNA polymerase subunit K/omega